VPYWSGIEVGKNSEAYVSINHKNSGAMTVKKQRKHNVMNVSLPSSDIGI
jgi:hypothetical protein